MLSTDPTDGPATSEMPRPTSLISDLIGTVLVGLTVAVLSISFAVIVWGNTLPEFLDRGITLALLGSAIAAIVSGLYGTMRAVASHAQDATALLLAVGLAGLFAGMSATSAPEVRFATAVVLVGASTFLTGAFCYFGGLMKLGFVTRFMPYPVVSGLLASIGYLLSLGSIGLMVPGPVDAFTLSAFLISGEINAWLPWGVAGALMLGAQRWVLPNRVLPIALGLGLTAFHGWLLISGTSLQDAEATGLLLGPFPDNASYDWLSLNILSDADWDAVVRTLPVVLALGPLTAITGVLNVQVIAQATRQDHDLDRDLRAIGMSNLGSGLVGGLVSYPAVSTTTLGGYLNVSSLGIWLGSSVICVIVAFTGTSVLAALPQGLFAMIVFYLGLSLLADALWKEARRMPLRDLLPVFAILLTTMFLGVLPALLVGIIVSISVFIVSYARLPFIRTDTTLALRRSIVERAEPNHALLQKIGQDVRVLELTGSLFFGTAFTLRQMIRAGLQSPDSMTHTILIDFRGVRDVDTSAISSLYRTLSDCKEQNVQVCLSGLRNSVRGRLERFIETESGALSPPRTFDTVDDALQTLETEILAHHHASGGPPAERQTFFSELQKAVPDVDLAGLFPEVVFRKNEEIIAQGAPSSEIYILVEGGAAAIVAADDHMPLIVARFEPGALIGEMAFYQGTARSATVIAEVESRLIRVDADRMRPGGDLPEALVSAFHQIAARHLSQRLAVATKLLRNAMP